MLIDEIREEWRDAPGFEGRYWVSNKGRVKSKRKALKPKINVDGYHYFDLGKGVGGDKRISAHALVLLTFDKARPVGMVIRHLDGNEKNNSLENICYGTYKENRADTVVHGTHVYGEATHNVKLTVKDAVFIQDNYKFQDKNLGLSALSRRFGVVKQSILNVVNGVTWVRAIKEYKE